MGNKEAFILTTSVAIICGLTLWFTFDATHTMYELYEIENILETFGRSILSTLDGNDERKYGYSGYFGGHVNAFDKKHTHMRAAVSPTNTPLEEYTLMPI